MKFCGVQQTDKLFQDSPNAGWPECICSRCGARISEDEIPLRCFIDEGRGGEYRYCEACTADENIN